MNTQRRTTIIIISSSSKIAYPITIVRDTIPGNTFILGE